MFTTSEVADILDLSPGRIRQMIIDGIIKAEKKGRDLMIPLSQIEEAKKRKTKPGPNPAKKRSAK